MTDSLHEEIFVEPKSSTGLKIIAAIAAVVLSVGLLLGYFYLRQRHAQEVGVATSNTVSPEPRKPPKALILVDDTTISGGKRTLGGTVRNTSKETLTDLQIELELKSRKGGQPEIRLIKLDPSSLQPEQEGRYSVELKAQDYSSARLVALKSGAETAAIPYTTAQGQKRTPERLDQKTITVDKRAPGKRDDFLNSPENPARVP